MLCHFVYSLIRGSGVLHFHLLMTRHLLEWDQKRQNNHECRTGYNKSEDIFHSNHVGIKDRGQLITAEDALNIRRPSAQNLCCIDIWRTARERLQKAVGEDGLGRCKEVATSNGLEHWTQGQTRQRILNDRLPNPY